MKLELADRFLKKFNYNLTTIQVFPTAINGKLRWPKKGGKYLATGKKGSSALAFKGILSKKKFLPDLIALQKQRMGVYFMVNEGDGELHGHDIVRNSESVHTLKALFVDTDEGNPKNLKKFCIEYKLKPHSIVESSPGKYHYYFLIEECEASKENIYLWQSCQQRLINIDPHYDRAMSDLGRVLRIPGFYHTKNKPFLIKEVYASNHRPYRLRQFFERIGAEKTPPHKGSTFDRPTKIISLGERHQNLNAYLGSVSNTTTDPEVLLDAAIGYAQRHFKNASEWLPGGSRSDELRDQIDYVIREREKEELENTIELTEQKPKTNFNKLPDDFYFKAPGLAGRMVKEICHYSAQPYPSFAFAASAALLGTLKAPFIRGQYRDTPPSTYFACLAATGRGKDFPRAIMAKVFVRLGFSNLLTQAFRSGQGFMQKLEKSKGIHLVLHDEAHHFFSQLKNSDSDYMTVIKPHFLRLYSSPNDPVYDVGNVVTDKAKIGIIPYPTVNYCGFGVPEGFESTFQEGELTEGLLTRFLIVRDHQNVQPINLKTQKVPKKFQFEEELRKMAMKLRILMESALLDDSNKAQESRKFMQIPIEPEAFQLLQEYSEKIAKERNSTKSKAIDMLQSRLVEQVARLSVILSDTVTTKYIVKWCIKFVDHCYENIAQHVESFGKGQGNKDLDDLLNFINERMRINKGPMQAQELCYFRIRDHYALKNTLQLGLDLNKIVKLDRYRKPGITKGRISTAYKIIESI